VEGRREVREAHRQHQANPSHLWSPPAEYHEPEDAPARVVPASAIYLKLRTQGGLEALYGPIDHEAVPVLQRDLASFLAGRDPLAVEALWDQMYRSNRHARAGHFMMATSAADNALWDLRGRLLGLPVFRLLGGARARVPVYASCLGFSLEPGKAEEKARALQAEGWRAQKWFLAHGPAEGREGLVKNVDLVRRLRAAVARAPTSCSTRTWAGTCRTRSPGRRRPSPSTRAGSRRRSRPTASRASPPCARPPPSRWPRASTSTAAGGERYLQARALQVVQADPEWCGG